MSAAKTLGSNESTDTKWTLWLTPRSPFARRIRLALLRLDLPFQSVEATPLEPTPDFLVTNPLGLVPVLRDPNGERWLDSSLMLDLLHTHTGKIWSNDPLLAAREHQVSNLAQGIMHSGVQLHFEGHRPTPDPSWRADFEQTAERTLKELSKPEYFRLLRKADGQLTQPGWDVAVALEYAMLRIPQVDWKKVAPILITIFDQALREKQFQATRPPEFMTQ